MITYQWDSESVARVRRKLGKYESETPKVLRNAANKTAVSAKLRLRQVAQERYTVKAGGFNSRANITRATTANPTAVIKFRGRPLTSARFHYTAPKTGARLEVLKGEGLKPLTIQADGKDIKAWYGKVISGNKKPVKRSAFRRLISKLGHQSDDGMEGGHLTGQILQREGSSRYPIKVLSSVGVAKMIETVYDGRGLKQTPLKEEIDKLYKHYTDQEIQRVINAS